MAEACETCRFWKRLSDDMRNHSYSGRDCGWCRVKAPVAGKGCPITPPDFWCGDHECCAPQHKQYRFVCGQKVTATDHTSGLRLQGTVRSVHVECHGSCPQVEIWYDVTFDGWKFVRKVRESDVQAVVDDDSSKASVNEDVFKDDPVMQLRQLNCDITEYALEGVCALIDGNNQKLGFELNNKIKGWKQRTKVFVEELRSKWLNS